MKVLMVADARSVHTRRWAVSLQERGIGIVLFSLYPSPDNFFAEKDIALHVFDLFTYKQYRGIRALTGMLSGHAAAVSQLKKLIRNESPDILHAHYVTSFGLVAALAGFRPFLVSVWGSDVYEFPDSSLINRLSVKYVLRRADRILSTSHVMARRTSRFTGKEIAVTPFGVDIEKFKKITVKKDDTFVVGNVKTLSPKYGIDVLIRAFRMVKDNNPNLKTVLVIVGDGPCRNEYIGLAEELGMKDDVKFIGKVPNDKLLWYYNSFSVSVSLSDSESFGVVAVEAMACCCPVVVSDADGFTEVVEDGVTGFIVPKRDPSAAAAAIQKFINDPVLRDRMGAAGRERVCRFYEWNDNVSGMISIYNEVCDGGRS